MGHTRQQQCKLTEGEFKPDCAPAAPGLQARKGDAGDAAKETKKKKRRRDPKILVGIRERGRQIADMPGAVRERSSVRWGVLSQSVRGLWHVVVLCAAGLVCSCDGAAGGRQLCKHAAGVGEIMRRQWRGALGRIRIGRAPRRCPDRGCRPPAGFIKYGRRKCRQKTEQRYMCRSCGRTFSGIDGFRGRHSPAWAVVAALSMVATGLSPAQARDQLALLGITVHCSTISGWAGHYSGMMERYAAALRVHAGFRWHVDEVCIRILGRERYLFAVMCGASRFVLSYEISPTKLGFDPAGLFAAAAARAAALPRILVTDGLPAFIPAAKKTFYRSAGPRFVHVREIHIRNEFNQNNLHERLNGEFKDRLGRIRGMKADSPSVASLMITYHNFFRPHAGIGGRTPAEAANIEIVPEPGAESRSREDWITFIQNAALCAAAAAA